MEKSWKIIEHIRDGDEKAAWEVAQALAKAVLETQVVVLAGAVLEGGPFALRGALTLAERIIEAELSGTARAVLARRAGK
jgi:hypothetical protein